MNYFLRNLNKLLKNFLPSNIKIHPSGILKTRTPSGNQILFATNQTNYVTKLIFWEGGLGNFEYSKIFLAMAPQIESFIDVGANIGYYSLLMAAENPKAKVIAFEPASGPLFYLQKNVSLNNFHNIKTENLALSNNAGTLLFNEIQNEKYKYLIHNLGGQSSMGSNYKKLNVKKSNVFSITLDEYVANEKLNSVDLIKLDTEGTEDRILAKASQVINKFQPIIICETLFNVIESRLEEIFNKYGYEFYNFKGGRLEKVETLYRSEDNGVRDCFFVPPSKYHLIEKFVIK